MLLQVFEYLSTDLKKFMDRTGKGNANPMPPKLIKVTVQVNVFVAAAVLRSHFTFRSCFCAELHVSTHQRYSTLP